MTPAVRHYSPKLEDKTIVYQPTNTPGNKPIAVGHNYSLLACLPEKTSPFPWVIPLDLSRVKSREKGHELGIDQYLSWIKVNQGTLQNKTSVLVADSSYSVQPNQLKIDETPEVILIARMKSNLNVYRIYSGSSAHQKYGDKMKLNDSHSHLPVDKEIALDLKNGKRHYRVEIKQWKNLVRRGSRTFKGYLHPFDLYQCVVRDPHTRERVFKRPMWLAVYGQKRAELSLEEVYQSYHQRYDVEHFFRFSKQHLLLNSFQTPDVEHEQHWWQIVQLAYLQLYLARTEIKALPYEWERYLSEYKTEQQEASPSQVKRAFSFILNKIGTPAHEVLPSKAGQGRQRGETQEKRQDSPIIFKGSKKKKNQNKTKIETQNNPTSTFREIPSQTETPKFNQLLKTVRQMIQQSELDLVQFAQKLMVSDVLLE